MLPDLTTLELEEIFEQKEHAMLLFYTPFCGTCQLAERMLEITQEVKGGSISAYKCHVSDFQSYVTEWKVKSVPCLVVVKNGKMAEMVYAIDSVSNLYALYDQFFSF